MNTNDPLPEFSRRNFLKNTSFATMMAMMGGVDLRAEEAAKTGAAAAPALTPIPVGPTVKCGVIGIGTWGRDVIAQLALLPNAPIVAVCDKRAPALRRAGELAPTAEKFDDYKKLLASPEVEAVVISTPTPSHKDIALAALAAGKHVYCEAPLANTIDDAKAIAKAARDNLKVYFQPGLQERSHPERAFLLPYIRSGAPGDIVMVRAQSHQNKSWENTMWKTDAATSPGIMGEVGIHQLDAVSWFMRMRPSAVTAFGSQVKPVGNVADTVQAIFEFPGTTTRFMYDATICNSFDKDYEIYCGTQQTIMVRDGKAWGFYEPEAQLGGWEVYAHKDEFYNETGIALMAGATKQTAIGNKATSAPVDTPLHFSLQAFVNNAGQWRSAVKDYTDTFGDDMSGLAASLQSLKPYYHAATWREGLDATIIALKANEAVVEQRKITLEKGLFDI